MDKKTLYVVSLEDCGKSIIIDILKNNISISEKYKLLEPQPPINHILGKIKNLVLIFIFRDVRIAWLISEYKKKGIDQYIKKFNDLLDTYHEVSKDQEILITTYENFLINKLATYNRLCTALDVEYDASYISNFFREKTSMLSIFDIEKIIKFQKSVDDDQLSYISSKTKEYNKFFNYPYNLSKRDILRGLSV